MKRIYLVIILFFFCCTMLQAEQTASVLRPTQLKMKIAAIAGINNSLVMNFAYSKGGAKSPMVKKLNDLVNERKPDPKEFIYEKTLVYNYDIESSQLTLNALVTIPGFTGEKYEITVPVRKYEILNQLYAQGFMFTSGYVPSAELIRRLEYSFKVTEIKPYIEEAVAVREGDDINLVITLKKSYPQFSLKSGLLMQQLTFAANVKSFDSSATKSNLDYFRKGLVDILEVYAIPAVSGSNPPAYLLDFEITGPQKQEVPPMEVKMISYRAGAFMKISQAGIFKSNVKVSAPKLALSEVIAKRDSVYETGKKSGEKFIEYLLDNEFQYK